VFTVKNLSTSEPEENLFIVPGDYKIVDHRGEKSVPNN
jgi:hypothetical protein